MHKIHITEGVVLEKRSLGEANVRVALLTRDLGLVKASARSARLGQSKLRYGLEPLTFARYCLVRGRREWRLTGVEAPERALGGRGARAASGRIAQLLLRLVTGEEPNAELYRDVAEGFTLIASQNAPLRRDEHDPNSSVEHFASLEAIEVVLVLRILSHLGYLPHTEALAPFIQNEFSLDLSAKALESKALLVRTINESLRASGL